MKRMEIGLPGLDSLGPSWASPASRAKIDVKVSEILATESRLNSLEEAVGNRIEFNI